VDLEPTDDQELFKETTAKFIERTCPLPTVREWAEKEPTGYPPAWWCQGAELGWTSLLVSEVDGGGSVSGHGLVDLTLVAEVMGHWVSPGPLLPTNVVAAALSEFATPAQKERYLPGLLSGEAIATWCLAEPRRSGLPPGVTLEATRQGDEFVLSGQKAPAEAAGDAGFFLVAARSSTARSPSSWLTRTLRASVSSRPRASTSSGASPPCPSIAWSWRRRQCSARTDERRHRSSGSSSWRSHSSAHPWWA